MNYQKKITNPITLIAIFATLSETSAAISLPFLDEEDRDLYVWFLISFPFYLLLLFFVTLNFNYRSLYAPSDFQDESNFVKATNNPKPMATDGGTRLSAPTPSNTRKGTQSVPSTSNAQAPPCDATQHKTGPEPERLQLPAEAKDLRIIDIRETSTQVELNGSLKSIWIPQNNAAQVIVFITCAKSEVLLKARMLKYLKQKRKANALYSVAYNSNSHKLAVIDQDWTTGLNS
jgi:hypothetical protein